MAPVTLSVRLIRSFEHRNIRHLVIKDVDVSVESVGQFVKRVTKLAKESKEIPPPFRNFGYDCLKIEHQAHGAKTTDPVINRDEDERLILENLDAKLQDCGVKNETVLSFFKREDYEKYKRNPDLKWE